jgi:hypothetical protein
MNTTLKTVAFLTVASIVFMGGCVKKLTTFGFDYSTKGRVSTNAFPTPGTHTLGETKMTSDLDSFVKAQGTSLDMLDELKIKSAIVTIEEPSGGNFDNCQNVDLWISADGSPEILIASKNPIPKGVSTVSLDLNSTENLANYLKAKEFTYRIKGTNTGDLPAMTMKVDAIWHAKASKK